jgi:MFS family permease
VSDKPTEVRVRRAPKFGRFAIIGGAVGAIATLAVTSAFPVDPAVGFWALFAYFALFGVTAGVVLGVVIALIFDAVSRRRARTVTVTRESISED